MKKFIISLVALSMLSLPCLQLQARRGSGAGVATGMGIGLMTGIAVSSASRRNSRAETEARRAQDQTEELRREQTKDKIYNIQRQMAQKETHGTMNLLIATIVLLFLGLLALGFVVLKRK